MTTSTKNVKKSPQPSFRYCPAGQQGRTAIVTGTGGIGFAIAHALACADANVIIAGRNAEKGAAAVSEIRKAFPDANVRFESLNLADLNSIASFCERIKKSETKIDTLMCIAGQMMPDEFVKTKDGVEMQFAVNYLGHFALTAGLFPLLKAGRDPRVVTTSSIANKPLRFKLGDATGELGYSASISYAFSKLSCLMFAVEFSKRSEENGWGVKAYAFHPGLARTQLFSRSHGFTMTLLQVIFFILPFIRQSAKHAALPALFAATSEKAVSGSYYGPLLCAVGPPRKALIPPRAKSQALRKSLWNLSVSLTNIEIN